MVEYQDGAHCHMWGQNQNSYYYWNEIFIRINIILRTRVQKWTYFGLLIENRKDISKNCSFFFVQNCEDMKK